MQENIQNTQNNNINILDNTIPEATGRGDKSKLFKIVFFVLIFLFLVSAATYYFYTKNNITPSQNTGNLFPDVKTGNDNNNETYTGNKDNNNNLDLSETEIDESGLINIWPLSVAGYSVINGISGTTTESNILFTDTLSGNVYVTNYPSLQNIRLTNTTLQNITKSTFSKNADYVLNIQKEGKINKLIGSRLGTERDSTFSVNNIDENVYDLASSRVENGFYYLKRLGKLSTLNSYVPATGKIIKISDIPLFDIFISSEDTNNIYLSSKPANGLSSVLVTVNKKTGSKHYTKTNLTGFEEKCVSTKNNYKVCGVDNTVGSNSFDIDLWNSGEVSFADEISITNKKTNESVTVPASVLVGEPLDIYKTNFINDFFIFENKNNDALWILKGEGF